MEKALKSINIGTKILARRSNEILLQTEDAEKPLGGNIITTKSVRLQTEYMGRRKTKVILHEVPLFISEAHLGFFYSKFGEVADVSAVKVRTGIATRDNGYSG